MALDHGIMLHINYIYRHVITITVTIVIINISEFLWISVVEDEGACGVGDVIKVSDGGCVSTM